MLGANLMIQHPNSGFQLVAWLCREAGVCLHDPESNPVEIHEARYHVEHGLQVRDSEGRVYRLEVNAKLVNPTGGDS